MYRFLRAVPFCAAVLLLLFPSCGGSAGRPPAVVPRIVRTLPHDTGAFTQGLFLARGRLYESAGLYGQSGVRMHDARSGALLKSVPLPAAYFGEGCAASGNTVVQITWREQTAFVYSLDSLAPAGQIMYGGEGWGLTSDGSRFFMSNGSDTIFVRNARFTVVKKIPVTMRGKPVANLNELEFARGKLYANIWYSTEIVEIDPGSGAVKRIVDCGELVNQERPSSDECVLNGIAWDRESDLFYVTGKKWKRLFVVQIPR